VTGQVATIPRSPKAARSPSPAAPGLGFAVDATHIWLGGDFGLVMHS
jgi:hypothetical protein